MRGLNSEQLDETPDEELVAIAISTGDSSVFTVLVDRHQSKIRNWLRQMTRNRALADDLAQDTFLQAWRRLESFKGSGTFAGWITKIAYNCFLKARNRLVREQAAMNELSGSAREEFRALDESWAELHRLMSCLSEEEQVAIVLNYAHGFSHGEIANITGMPIGTVKTHIRRGKARIGEQIKARAS